MLRVRSDGLKAIVATSAKDEELTRLVMIGDTPYDIEAAARARVRAIAFRSGGWTDEALKGAVEIYNGPADLVAKYESSLIGRESK